MNPSFGWPRKEMNIVTSNNNNGKPIILSGKTIRPDGINAGGPILRVSSSTPIIRQLDGSVTLVVTSSNSAALSPSPNVSVASKRNVIGGAKERARKDSGQREASFGVGATGSVSANSKSQKESKISLKPDLRNIMHAFGDASSPCEDSVDLMEQILKQEMSAFVFICETATYSGGAKAIGLRECVYALRYDKLLLARLFKYLIIKDQQRVIRMNQTKSAGPSKSYLLELREVLEDLGGFRELEHALGPGLNQDSTKTEKTSLVDPHSQRLINARFVNFAKARSVSFARKLPQLQEWITHFTNASSLGNNFLEVLAFVVYDLVAQIVDLSFVIKRERMFGWNPLLRMRDLRGTNPDTCMSSSIFLRKDEECNNVSEILVLASELEAKRLKKTTSLNQESVTPPATLCLFPSEIKEAYIRIRNSGPPSASFRSRAEKLRNLSFQYY